MIAGVLLFPGMYYTDMWVANLKSGIMLIEGKVPWIYYTEKEKLFCKVSFHKNKQKLEKFILDKLLPSLESPLQYPGERGEIIPLKISQNK